MEKYYFIIRVKEWCSGFYCGTMDELNSALGEIQAEITGTEHVDFERIGLTFDKRITTKMPVYGKDKKTFDGIMNEIVEVFNRHGINATKSDLENIYDLNYAATTKTVFDTDKLDVLVSDGEFHPKPNHGYIGVYDSYKPFSEFSEEWIWAEFGNLCGYSNPKLV